MTTQQSIRLGQCRMTAAASAARLAQPAHQVGPAAATHPMPGAHLTPAATLAGPHMPAQDQQQQALAGGLQLWLCGSSGGIRAGLPPPQGPRQQAVAWGHAPSQAVVGHWTAAAAAAVAASRSGLGHMAAGWAAAAWGPPHAAVMPRAGAEALGGGQPAGVGDIGS